jgi:hypothetical protein
MPSGFRDATPDFDGDVRRNEFAEVTTKTPTQKELRNIMEGA